MRCAAIKNKIKSKIKFCIRENFCIYNDESLEQSFIHSVQFYLGSEYLFGLRVGWIVFEDKFDIQKIVNQLNENIYSHKND